MKEALLRLCLEEHLYKSGEYDEVLLTNGKVIRALRTTDGWMLFSRNKDERTLHKCGEGEHIGRLLMKVLTRYNIEY